MKCRFCTSDLKYEFLDLGFAPPSNAYLTEAQLIEPEKYFPLRVLVCDQCWLVQTEDYTQAHELFTPDYAYFSSTSKSWMEHARQYFKKISKVIDLESDGFVVELASNDGYLLRNFQDSGIRCVGVEPAIATAEVAEGYGINTIREFFTEELAHQISGSHGQADLVIGNNVYAHVPDINDFTRGIKALLKPQGVVTLEFPHLLRLIEDGQFDTIYHEHFSYLSLSTVSRIFATAGLRVWDVESLPTHGGSLRVYGSLANADFEANARVEAVLEAEESLGLSKLSTYLAFQDRAEKIKNNFLSYLLEAKQAGKRVVAYGAAAKGNTLLNYAGIKPDLVSYVCDGASAKQGKFMPGSHIPIFAPDKLFNDSPDVIIVLPWNLKSEVEKLLEPLVKGGAVVKSLFPDFQLP
ncbi:MAG: class I SAM-dependent methyltransferase [Proteobacteria bacterium]|jgi:SAM-dependent methyltransferase|nr:class I SAM-dependent methyltransferase [Pseudomonadota bacterium]MDA0891150.1 class I SAM-dependent methyltransferase [Pseudomonadota bacterium]